MNRSVDILIPTYNRKKFSKQIIDNINRQDYPFINRVIIADDCDDDERLDVTGCNYIVEYYKVKRMSIGKKRNFLVSMSKAFYVANMDTDDYYHETYISSCIFNLIKSGKKITGSADMILKNEKGEIVRHNCCYLHLLNEATIVMERNLIDYIKYGDTNKGEGMKLLYNSENQIIETDIEKIMVCLVHSGNTIDKSSLFDKK